MSKPFSLTLTFNNGGKPKRVTKQFGSGAELAGWYDKCRPGRMERDQRIAAEESANSQKKA